MQGIRHRACGHEYALWHRGYRVNTAHGVHTHMGYIGSSASRVLTVASTRYGHAMRVHMRHSAYVTGTGLRVHHRHGTGRAMPGLHGGTGGTGTRGGCHRVAHTAQGSTGRIGHRTHGQASGHRGAQRASGGPQGTGTGAHMGHRWGTGGASGTGRGARGGRAGHRAHRGTWAHRMHTRIGRHVTGQ